MSGGGNMDIFLQLLSTTDPKKKLSIGNDIINFLSNPENSIECSDIGQFIDGLVPWIQSSNSKVAQNGLDILTFVVDRMDSDFRPYLSTVLPATIDRLGDGKDTVREKAQVLIMKFMDKVVTPQQVFEKLSPGFSHKNGKVREEVMLCLRTTLNEHGAQSLSISRLVPAIVKLLSDPMSTVRDTAFNTLVEIYRHVGERLRSDLQKKHNVPASKLPGLMSKFDEVRDSGDVLPTALQNSLVDGGRGDDETDRIANSAKRASSVPAPRRAIYTSNKPPPQSSAGSKVRRTSSLRRTSSAQSGQAGAVDEETFIRSFEDVPTIQLFSAKELEEQLVSIRETIADPNKDWSKRVESLKRLRALLLAGASNFDELYVHLRLLEPPFQISVKDLRSQVVREACITIAYLSQQLGHKCDRFTESLFPGLIYLIQSSAKVMATAGIVAIRFIIQNTHSPRLIPIIASNMSSKSKDIRRACCEFLDQLLHTWPTHTLERHIALLQDAIRKGIADADPEARASSRKAFWGFADHFRDQADSLLNSLDGSYKRLLHGELSLSNSSSSNSLNTTGSGRGTTPRSRASSTTGSTENLHRVPSLTRRSGIPVLASPKSDADGHGGGSPRHSPALRSNSAIDLQAAQRAKARAQYAAAARMKVGSGASLPRPRKSSDAGMSVSAITSPERVGRTRTRVSGVSQSQPSSRSGSPSSRLSYATYSAAGGDSNTVGRPRRLSGIPRSTGTSREASRETSPNRFASHDRSFGSKLRGRSLLGMTQSERPPQPARPVMAQKILQQSREAESALADALNFDNFDDFQRTPNRKAYRPFDDHSDDSETSSVCSERSFDSYRRPSDPYSWSGSQQRLYRDLWEPLNKDISEIITNCASTHWSDRKEGLVGLQNYFQTGNALTGSELKRVTEIFTKMFMDAHTKVFSLFLDTLNELIITHKADLQDWLYVLLTRLLNKLGADLLGSIQNKIHKSLDVVRDSFPCDQQFNVIVRFLVDQTQTPNSKVKVAVLSYLTQLTAQMEPMHFSSGKDTRMALSKIIGWTSDKSVEIRKAAHNTVIALFNLNTPEVTMLLSQLPKEYQEAAAALVQNHLRRSSTEGSPPSPLVSSPRLQSPGTPQPKSGRSSRSNTLDLDDENLNPEEVYRSLRRTTAEIQNYSFESLDRCGKLDRDRDTTSQDSGISQMSAGAGDKLDTLEERLEDCGSLNNSGSGRSSSLSSPIHRIPGCLREFNGLDKSGIGENPFEGENGYISRESHHHDDSEAIKKILEILNGDATDGRIAERKNALTQLIRLVREGSTLAVIDHFKVLLRVLLEQLTSPEGGVRALVLGVLMEMFKKRSMTACFQSYIELLILKVLQAHKDGDKDVVRAAEACAATMGSVLPADVVIRVLNPLIKTGDFPVNQAAIKMLTRLIEQKDKEAIEPHLTDLMPGLLKAYDNEESSVRKSAVFCMVALHSVVGEEDMTPHLKPLNGSKMKLLHLYIKRSKQSSEPASPKSTPPE